MSIIETWTSTCFGTSLKELSTNDSTSSIFDGVFLTTNELDPAI